MITEEMHLRYKKSVEEYFKTDMKFRGVKPILTTPSKTYTNLELLEEVKNETEFGIELLMSSIRVATMLYIKDTETMLNKIKDIN